MRTTLLHTNVFLLEFTRQVTLNKGCLAGTTIADEHELRMAQGTINGLPYSRYDRYRTRMHAHHRDTRYLRATDGAPCSLAHQFHASNTTSALAAAVGWQKRDCRIERVTKFVSLTLKRGMSMILCEVVYV